MIFIYIENNVKSLFSWPETHFLSSRELSPSGRFVSVPRLRDLWPLSYSFCNRGFLSRRKLKNCQYK